MALLYLVRMEKTTGNDISTAFRGPVDDGVMTRLPEVGAALRITASPIDPDCLFREIVTSTVTRVEGLDKFVAPGDTLLVYTTNSLYTLTLLNSTP